MDHITKEALEDACEAIAEMIGRSEKAQKKFAAGTASHTLQENRIQALRIASSLMANELAESGSARYTKEELEKALAPIASLTSKSEKAREKLRQGTWQHTMLGNTIRALHIAMPLLKKALREIQSTE